MTLRTEIKRISEKYEWDCQHYNDDNPTKPGPEDKLVDALLALFREKAEKCIPKNENLRKGSSNAVSFYNAEIRRCNNLRDKIRRNISKEFDK